MDIDVRFIIKHSYIHPDPSVRLTTEKKEKKTKVNIYVNELYPIIPNHNTGAKFIPYSPLNLKFRHRGDKI